jgi:hypothetical protein
MIKFALGIVCALMFMYPDTTKDWFGTTVDTVSSAGSWIGEKIEWVSEKVNKDD